MFSRKEKWIEIELHKYKTKVMLRFTSILRDSIKIKQEQYLHNERKKEGLLSHTKFASIIDRKLRDNNNEK